MSYLNIDADRAANTRSLSLELDEAKASFDQLADRVRELTRPLENLLALIEGFDGADVKPISRAAQTLAQEIRALTGAAKPIDSAEALRAFFSMDLPPVQDVAGAPIDAAELLNRCMNNVDLAKRVLAKFEQRAMEDLGRLAGSLKENDLLAAAKLAHAIKGMAANVSAKRVLATSAEIESLVMGADESGMESAMERLVAETKSAVQYVSQAMSRLSPGTDATGLQERSGRCMP